MLVCRTLYLVHALALAHAFSIQPHHSKRAPAQSTISILDKISETSVNGACKFPSTPSVLHDFETFAFFEECNRQLPTQFTPHTPPEDILCMGLYEIGSRLCSVITEYQLPLTGIPNESSELKKLINDPHDKELNAKLCSEFESLPMPQSQEIKSLEVWNIFRIFKNNPQACSQICLYINGDAKELCKLILWGNKLFLDSLRESKQAMQRLPDLKSSDLQVNAKSVGVPFVNPKHKIPETGVEKSSPNQQEPTLKDQSSPRVSSQGSSYDNSQNSTPKKSVKLTDDDQKADIDHSTDGSKHPLPDSLPESDNAHIVDQVDNPEPEYQRESPSISENEKVTKPIKPNVEAAKLLKKESNADNLSPKKQDEDNREAKIDGQVIKAKDAATAAASSPASAPIAIAHAPIAPISHEALDALNEAPETPDEIVLDTASNPSVDANQDTIGAEDLSKYDDPNLEQGDDEDMHFPPIGVEQPTKTDEALNGDEEYLKPREDIKYVHERFEESEDSHFFRYFMTMVVICILGYLLFHNKQKILALFLEGRSRRGTRRRPNTANYHKLDCNLEEAVSSPCSTSVAHVIY